MKKFGILLSALLLTLAAILTTALAVQARPPGQGAGITLRIEEVNSGLPDVKGKLGERVIMRVIAEDAEDMAGLQFILEFDTSVVRVSSSGVDSSPLIGGFLFSSNVANNQGPVNIILASATAPGNSSYAIADITFDLVGSPGASTVIALTNVAAADQSLPPRSIAVTSIDGSITMSTPEPQGDGEEPTPTPTSTPTPTLEPTVVPTPSVTSTAPATQTPISAVTPTPTLPIGATPSPTSTPTLPTVSTPAPTATPTLPTVSTPAPTATQTPPTVSTLTATPTLASSPKSTPAPGLMPTPVPTPSPSFTAQPTTPTAAQPTPTATPTPAPTAAPSNGGCGAPLGEVSSVSGGWLLLGLMLPGLALARRGKRPTGKG